MPNKDLPAVAVYMYISIILLISMTLWATMRRKMGSLYTLFWCYVLSITFRER